MMKKQRGSHFKSGQLFFRRLLHMVRKPIFIVLTITGNFVIFASAIAIYRLEFGINPRIKTLLDTLWWAVATVTTVGYGDISPITDAGKLVGIATMIIGTALFWSYTALFAEALISSEIVDVEMELRNISQTLEKIAGQEVLKEEETQKIIHQLQTSIDGLKSRKHI